MSQDAISKFEKQYAKIDSTWVGLGKGDNLTLELTLTCEDAQASDLTLENHDIVGLLKETGQRSISRLKGMVIEVYLKNNRVECIGANRNLINSEEE